MPNPFIYEEPVEPSALIDRREELGTLARRADEARNSRLEGPRRYGKTSLLRAVLTEAQNDGAVSVEVDFLGCVSAADVAERIERAYGEQLDSRLRRWYDGLIRTLQPTVSAAPAGVGVKAQPAVAAPGLLDRLALPRRIHERTGRMCLIAFDEFQEVLNVSPALPGVFRSELEHHGPAAAYIFSGSHPGLMQKMFSDRRHAFFAQAAPVRLGPLAANDLADHIATRFAEGERDPGDALGPLLDTAEGHPQRAMLLAYHLHERVPRRASATLETWIDALEAARREVQGEAQVLWESSTELERRVLKVIAHRTVALASREAEARFGLAKGGSTKAAVDRLYGDGHIVGDESTRTGWRVLDPFFAAWLRGE